MTRRRLFLLGSIALIVGLTYWLINTPLITDVLAPLIYATLLTLISAINSLPQIFVWIAFMFIVVQLLTSGLVRFARAMRYKQDRSDPPEAERVLSPVQKYKRWLDRTNQGVYFRWRVTERLIQMTQDIQGRGSTRSRPQLEQEIRENAYNLPPHVSQFLENGLDARNHVETPRSRLQSLLDNRPADHGELAATLTYLEDELGIRNVFDEQP